MTYARTSVVLALVLIGLYGFFTIYFHKRGDWITFGVLVSTLLVSFTVVSLWGPADIHKRIQAPKAMVATKSLAPKVSNDVKKQDVRKKDVAKKPTKPRATPNIERDLAQSHLFKNAVKSSFDSKSRSNPTRIQDFIMKLEGFKLHPILGSGDTLGLVTQKRLMEKNYSKLTREMRQRLSYTEKKGLFQSGIGGNGLYIPGMLVSRGLLGFLAFFGPIFALGVALFRRVLKTGTSISNVSVCVFISAAGSFLGAFSQGLWYFYFWGAASLALGVVLECSDKNDHVGWLKFMPLTEKTETVGVLPILRKVIEKLPIKSRHEFT